MHMNYLHFILPELSVYFPIAHVNMFTICYNQFYRWLTPAGWPIHLNLCKSLIVCWLTGPIGWYRCFCCQFRQKLQNFPQIRCLEKNPSFFLSDFHLTILPNSSNPFHKISTYQSIIFPDSLANDYIHVFPVPMIFPYFENLLLKKGFTFFFCFVRSF